MGLILRSIVTCLFVTYAFGVEFKFPDNDTACIMAQMTINFTLSNGGEKQHLSEPFVDTEKSSCASNGSISTLALKWKEDNDTMTFTFMLNTGKVEMRVVYAFIPLLHFKESKDPNLTILESTANFELSMSNMSYKCDSLQDIILKKNMYQLVMSFAKVQVQAFGVENGTFSNFEECDMDSLTTEAPHTQTTPHHSTTMKPPAQFLYKYFEKGSKNACILLKAAIQLDINYMDTEESVATAKVYVPNPVRVNITGHCAKSDTGNASIALNWFYGKSRFSVKMDFIADKGISKLEMIEVDAELFRDEYPDLYDNSTEVMSMRNVDFSSSKVTYYMCNTLQEEKLDNITTVAIYKIQVQAFGVKNSNFTGEGTECSQEITTDKTTTETTHMSTITNTTTVTTDTTKTEVVTTVTTPTAGPKTTATPHPINNYNVSNNNVTCIVFMAGMDFTFQYTMKNGTNTSILVSVPPSFKANGSCDTQTHNDTQNNELNIYFNMDWSLKFVFGYDNSSSQLGDSMPNVYSIHSVTLDYTVDSSSFPGFDVNGSVHYTAMANITSPLFQSKVNGSYKCNAQTEVPFIRNSMTVTLETYNLQYKAFNKDNNTAFGGELRECSADNSSDNKTNSVVPIAVGAALAGLVVIVLIAYLIGRRRNRKGYESV